MKTLSLINSNMQNSLIFKRKRKITIGMTFKAHNLLKLATT